MTTYRAPIRDMQFVINELAGLENLAALPGYEEVSPDLAESVLEEAAKIAGEVLAPLNKPGDERGASLTKEGVVAAEGFGAAYRQFVENGWNGLSGDPEYGGQGAAFGDHGGHGRDVELGQYELCPLSLANRRGDGGDQSPRIRRT